MFFNNLTVPARLRVLALDAAVAAGVTLVAITAAHAALPDREPIKPAPVAIAAPVAPQPAALIAFSDPVPGQAVTSRFGLRKLPWEEVWRLHAGVDISAAKGAPVLAAADGVVAEAGRDGGNGRFVKLVHVEGITSFYAHLSDVDEGLTPGLLVRAGSRIGAIGSSGSSTGPHLHLEIRDAKGRPLNPSLFLGRRFMTAQDLPLAEAARIPRGARVAYVSNIPRDKRLLMAAKAQEKAEAAEAERLAREAARAERLAARRAGAEAGRPTATIAGVERNDATPIDEAHAPS